MSLPPPITDGPHGPRSAPGEPDPPWILDDGTDELGFDPVSCILGSAAWVAWLGACAAAGAGLSWAVARRVWPR